MEKPTGYTKGPWKWAFIGTSGRWTLVTKEEPVDLDSDYFVQKPMDLRIQEKSIDMYELLKELATVWSFTYKEKVLKLIEEIENVPRGTSEEKA